MTRAQLVGTRAENNAIYINNIKVINNKNKMGKWTQQEIFLREMCHVQVLNTALSNLLHLTQLTRTGISGQHHIHRCKICIQQIYPKSVNKSLDAHLHPESDLWTPNPSISSNGEEKEERKKKKKKKKKGGGGGGRERKKLHQQAMAELKTCYWFPYSFYICHNINN